MNELARSITQWTKACDKRLSRLISYIHHTCDYKQQGKWETLQNNADWDCFKTSILQKILRIQNLHQVEHCAFSDVIRLFQSVGCVRNKLLSRTVQQNQILDAGLRLDGIPAPDLWDLIVAVLYVNTNQSNQARGNLCTNLVRVQPHKFPTRKKSHGKINDLDNVDLFPQTSILLVRKLCCIFMKTTKQ